MTSFPGDQVPPFRPARGMRCNLARPRAIITTALAIGMFCLASACGDLSAELRVAVFDVDVSPPIGSPVAYAPTRKIVDPLSARGIVLLGADRPIVLCAVDYIGIGNGGNAAWRAALADAAGTTPDRVAVHSLHQHDTPRCDFTASDLLAAHHAAARHFDDAHLRKTIARTADSVRAAVTNSQPLTHLGVGHAKVEQVASNRRLLGDDGRVKLMRWSKSSNADAIAAPEGVIDPLVRTVGMFNGETVIAVLTYYATHPQSYYGQGDVTCEFVGLARNARQQALGGALHIHFSGAGGNVAAGKYNDGSAGRRPVLAKRMEAGMQAAWQGIERFAITADDVQWRVQPVALPPGEHLNEASLLAILENPAADPTSRLSAASHLAWLRRCVAGEKIDLTCLKLGSTYLLHMPGELFVEFQLAAAAMRPDDEVCMAAYGDYGPGYIGTEIAYSQGGYETSPRASRVAPEVERVMMDGLRTLLK